MLELNDEMVIIHCIFNDAILCLNGKKLHRYCIDILFYVTGIEREKQERNKQQRGLIETLS